MRSLRPRKPSISNLDRLRARCEAQAVQIEAQSAALAHSRKIFDRASEAARIGVWECDLDSSNLRWSDVVYDLFGLPRGSALDRDAILNFYTEASRRELEHVRGNAIAKGLGFEFDAEIITARGPRWIRITATVECENGAPVRIFGMKQDITEAKKLSDRLRHLADYDVVTGLANRRQFQGRLTEFAARSPGPDAEALILVDLDAFKTINDTFGHALGDEGLREAASRLRRIFADAELVARIGGDEFAVLVKSARGRADIEALAGDFVASLVLPVERLDQAFRLGASLGIAYVEGSTAAELFSRADAALYAAKAAGRNTFRVADRLSPERAKNSCAA